MPGIRSPRNACLAFACILCTGLALASPASASEIMFASTLHFEICMGVYAGPSPRLPVVNNDGVVVYLPGDGGFYAWGYRISGSCGGADIGVGGAGIIMEFSIESQDGAEDDGEGPEPAGP